MVPGTQATINRCGPAVIWENAKFNPKFTWLAGHNYCGFSAWSKLRIGSIFKIVTGGKTYTYRITGRRYLPYGTQYSPPDLLRGNLMLQTCVGKSYGFTYGTLLSVK